MSLTLKKNLCIAVTGIFLNCFFVNLLLAVDNPFLPDDDICSDEIIENDLPSGYSAANIWYQVMTTSSAHNQTTDGEAIIQIASDRVIEECENTTKIIYERDYTDYKIAPTNQYGALYLRDPWFGGNNFTEELSNTYVQNDALTISVGGTPDRVAHWWTDRFNVSSSCKYLSEINFKITGAATFQVGSDWWRTTSAPYSGWDAACITSNNCEAWLSDWFSDTGGQFITIKVPYHNKCTTAIPRTPKEVDITPVEGSINAFTYFLLQLNRPLSVKASVDFFTQDNTATAGQDYVASSGTATILAGETSTVIGVEIIADEISESDENFNLILSNPQGASFPSGVSKISAHRTIVNDD